MAGTTKGGVKAMATNQLRYGLNFPEQIGRMGGKARGKLNHDGTGRGFARDAKWAAEMGRKGNKLSQLARAKNKTKAS